MHFSLPCCSFVSPTIWESASLSRGSYFLEAARSFRRLSGSDGRTDVRPPARPLARYRGARTHVKTTALRKKHSVCTRSRPFIIFSARRRRRKRNPDRKPASPHRASLRIPTCNTSTFFGGLVFTPPLPPPFAKKCFTVLTPGSQNRVFAQGINTLIALWLASNH